MNQLTKVFEGQSIRILGTEENPLFVLRDVCDALSIKHTQPIVQRLDGDVFSKYIVETTSGMQEMTVVNEDGLYDIILDSRKAEAKRFRKWITRDVLPSIRQTGNYSIANQEFSPQLQLLMNMELEQKRISQEVDSVKEDLGNVRDILSLELKDWRNGVNKLLNGIAFQLGGFASYQDIRNESYQLLEMKAGCDLGIRLNNRKSKAALKGMSKTSVNKISKLDVIAEDKKLISVYITVVKEMGVKYKLDVNKYDLPDVL